MDKLISIIIPVFNRESLVGETLDSILGQSYTLWECILVDDGSSDGTMDVLRRYQLMDERFRVCQRPDSAVKGAPSCRNYGFSKSTGDVIQFFDSDDIMLPDMLADKLRYLNDNPDAAFVVSKMGEFDGDGMRPAPQYAITSDRITLDFLRYKVYFLTPGPMFRRKFLEKFPIKFDVELKKNQEREFYSRIMLEEQTFGTIEKTHCLRRIHKDSVANFHKESDLRKKLTTKLDFFIRLRKNTFGKYDKVLFSAYHKELFKLSIHLIRNFEFRSALECIILFFSLFLASIKGRSDTEVSEQ